MPQEDINLNLDWLGPIAGFIGLLGLALFGMQNNHHQQQSNNNNNNYQYQNPPPPNHHNNQVKKPCGCSAGKKNKY